MIEISFFKILVVLLVALIVLGPERTPQAARSLGRLVARLRHFMSQAQKEFNQVTKESQDSETKT